MLRAERNKGLIVCWCRCGVVGTVAADGVAHAFDVIGKASTAGIVHSGWQLYWWGGVGP